MSLDEDREDRGDGPVEQPSRRRSGAPARSSWRPEAVRLALVAAAPIGLRWRFLFTPITSDEGGYLAVARAWSRGASLYKDVWVDRPQALLLQYRFLYQVGLGTPTGVRVLAIVVSIVGALAAAIVGRELGGPRALVPCGLSVALLTATPKIEGFIANAELLSGCFGIAGLALFFVSSRRDSPALSVGAGAIGGFALLTKQSAVDTVALVSLMIVLRLYRGRRLPTRTEWSYFTGLCGMLLLAVLK